ncbi:class I SAM-dependent methyltransferase [Williamsia sp. M5A3_1d]
MRTHLLDRWCGEICASDDITQIVILGAGLDTRADRLNWLSDGISVFEIDRSDVAELKAAGLGVDDQRLRGISADLTTLSWAEQLRSAGFDSSVPTLFITEGLSCTSRMTMRER